MTTLRTRISWFRFFLVALCHLSSCFWICATKLWEVAGTYELGFFLHKNACSWSNGDNLRWWGHSNPTHNLIR